MKILSFGAGMQSTALALMSCENAKAKGDVPYPLVPVYDAVIYCDLGFEPPWVYHQLNLPEKPAKMRVSSSRYWTHHCIRTF